MKLAKCHGICTWNSPSTTVFVHGTRQVPWYMHMKLATEPAKLLSKWYIHERTTKPLTQMASLNLPIFLSETHPKHAEIAKLAVTR